MNIFFRLCLFFLFLLTVGCTSQTPQLFREKGKAISRQLIEELSEIETRSDLSRLSGNLKKKFNQLVDLMIAAKQFRLKHPSVSLEEDNPTSDSISDALKVELSRICQIDGATELIEACQKDALERLYRFEQALKKS